MTRSTIARLTLGLVLVLGLAACETTEGFIDDSQNVGDAVADTI
jgi:predicted small secreted protein